MKSSSAAAAAAMMLVIMLIVASRGASACGATSELASCLPAAEADVQPTTECCTMLTSYVTDEDSDDCLCQVASSSAFESSGAVVEYAITIPEKCNLTYKAGTECNGVTIPGGQ